ncbi:YopX family protein [Staphylococcus epidermidis]|uniref:YopX family protein n=1 Tax=Staphylococcus epidermidis TaxID=1282 RepID=UPI0020921B8B|nr:YopX family protein [Staphylococcus epidermidis]MCO6293916.1 YopX family protein [Staphylococcus epidermidis]
MIPKFRAWDKDERAMLDVHGINFDAQGIWTNELIDDESDGNFIFIDDVVLMQSTGLKDKNGVEIYEGDIIRGPYDTGIIGYEMVTTEVKYDLLKGLQLGQFDLNITEVIGNIYEKSELLEDN